jgi:hypothetical protein
MPLRSAAAAAVAILFSGAPAVSQPVPPPIERTVSVSATGSVAAAPDRASISTGVLTEGATAREAMAQNSAVMQKLIEGLKALGIDAKDIQTTAINISPRYTQPRNNQPPTINGYQAQNQVRIVVRKLQTLGDILDKATSLGANQMGGISFDVSNAETLKDDARKVAMTNARRRAELYAVAAGVSLGPVLSISETFRDGPLPVRGNMRAAMADSVPVEPGSVDLSVQVHVTYGLR